MCHIGEARFNAWVRAHRIAVIVPTRDAGIEVAVPVARSHSCALMICIAINGHSIKPYAVVTRRMLEVELYESDSPPENSCIVHQENGFIISRSSHDWLEEVLIPDVVTRRERLRWEGPVFLILTGFLDITLTLLTTY
jgi:hypothetical protein